MSSGRDSFVAGGDVVVNSYFLPAGEHSDESEVAEASLDQARRLWASLLGTDKVSVVAANVRFTRDQDRRQPPGGGPGGSLESVLGYYQALSPRRLVILGEPGSGKTVMALQLQLGLLKQWLNDRAGPVPVLISAASCDTARPWEEWLADHLVRRFYLDNRSAVRLVRGNRILPVVDGLDEMDAGPGTPERAAQLADSLNAWLQDTELAPAIVTCRRAEYDLLDGIDRATHVGLEPLSARDVARYLRERPRSESEARRWAPVADLLAAQADGIEDAEGLLAGREQITPWRLTLALAASGDGLDPARLLAAAAAPRGEESEPADRLLLDAYLTSAVRLHGKGQYAHDDVRRWLAGLADDLARPAAQQASGTDIELARWRAEPGNAARYLHLAVAAIPILPWLLPGVATGFYWLFAACVTALTLLTACSPRPLARRASLRSLNLRHFDGDQYVGRPLLVRQVLGGVVAAGAAAALMTFWASDASRGLAGAALAAILIPLAVPVMARLARLTAEGVAELPVEVRPRAVGPRDVIRSEGKYLAITVPALVALLPIAAALAYGLAGWHAAWAAAGFMVAGVSGAVVGSSAWVRYRIVVVLSAARGRAPLRFGTFLDWARDAGLLRECGIAYQFRHRELQDHLASQPAAGGK
ncbi:MAG TPA: NACHT domain-containing protein [Trebonia sp.]|nr:NACHT domain-containing protein [Trebonia sp.]